MNINKKRIIPLVAAVTLTGTLGLLGGSSSASILGGLVHVYDVNTGTGPIGSIVITGAFADSGADHANVGPDANRMVLSKGTFEVNTSAISQKFNTASPIFNPTNCGVVLAVTAPVTLFNGTGAYRGIVGKLMLSITNATVLPRKPNGKCNESPNAVPVGEITIDQGSGTISFK